MKLETLWTMYDCRYCVQEFSTSSNRKRHERKYHEDELEDEKDEDDSGISDNEGDNDDGGMKTDEEDPSEDEANMAEDEVWETILHNVYADMTFPEDMTYQAILKDKGYMNEIIKEIRQKISGWEIIVPFLHNDSEVYGKLMKTRERLMETEDYTDEEATKKAFKDRKGLFKQVVKDNAHVLAEALKEDGLDEDGDEEDDKEPYQPNED